MAKPRNDHINVSTQSVQNNYPYFTYDPLPEGWIRLARILDIDEHDYDSCHRHLSEETVRVSIEHYEATSCPEYVALSYTWGPATTDVDPTTTVFVQEPRCFPIVCSDRLLRGTRNLRDALLYLRFTLRTNKCPYTIKSEELSRASSHYSECFWIDAICINQGDLHERAQQVAIMNKIYSRAKSCIAWLGKAESSIEDVRQIAVDLLNGSQLHGGERTFNKLMNYAPEKLASLARLLCRSWFFRLWVLQEVVLARKVFFQYGSSILEFAAIASIARLTRSPKMSLIIDSALSASDRKLRPIPNLRHYSILTVLITLERIWSYKESLHKEEKMDLLSALDMSGYCSSSDPRDRIYGLIGMTSLSDSSNMALLPIKYDLPVEAVYKQAIQIITQQRKDARFLYSIGHAKAKMTRKLPSWCPDYSLNRQCIPPHIDPDEYQQWLHRSKTYPMLQFHDDILSMRGFRHDIIVDIVDLESPKAVSDILKMAFHTQKDINLRIHLLWKTLLRGEINGKTPEQEIGALFLSPFLLLLLSESIRRPQFQGEGRTELTSRQELEHCASVFDQIQNQAPQCSRFLPDPREIYHLSASCPRINLPYSTRNSQAIFDSTPRDKAHVSPEGPERHATDVGDDPVASVTRLVIEEALHVPVKAQELGLEMGLRKLFDIETSQYFIADSQEHMTTIYNEPMVRLLYLSIFSTYQSGEMGQCFSWVRENDELWFLHGFPSPVVLRPLESGRFRFLGPVYIPDLPGPEVIHTAEFWSKTQQVDIE